jgi:hypothetical protein
MFYHARKIIFLPELQLQTTNNRSGFWRFKIRLIMIVKKIPERKTIAFCKVLIMIDCVLHRNAEMYVSMFVTMASVVNKNWLYEMESIIFIYFNISILLKSNFNM